MSQIASCIARRSPQVPCRVPAGCSLRAVPTIQRGGVRLFYEDLGVGPPVVLHTGGAGSSEMWRAGGYVERLAGFRTILFDHRGRGRSDRPIDPAAHKLMEFVEDVVALADHLGLDRYAFFGYSFGGLVGLELAARDPRVVSLVVLGTVFDPPDLEWAASASDQGAREASMEVVVETMEQEERLVLPDWLREEFLRTDPRQFFLTIDSNALDPEPWETLGSIVARTVLIAGAEEDPNDNQAAMAERIPGASSVHIPGVAHVGVFLRPDEVLAAALPTLRASGNRG
jgi:pimeloyl-ACP methyl ester carboxylesterase